MPYLLLVHEETTGWIPREDPTVPIPHSLGTKPVHTKRPDPNDESKEIPVKAVLECIEDKQRVGRIPITVKQADILKHIKPDRTDVVYEESPAPTPPDDDDND